MRVFVAALLLLASGSALALELGGHDIPQTVRVGDQTLVLNGAGIRKKLFSRVYVCALYLPKLTRDASAILDSDRPWQVAMHFMRNIDHHDVLQAFKDSFERDPLPQSPQSEAELEKFHVVLDDLKKGQDLTIRYVPGVGTTLHAPTANSSTVPGREFANAILRTWLGSNPVDPQLKDKMLGM